MDDTTRKIVKFVSEFRESALTPSVVRAVNRTMVDSMAATIAGFEEEAVRIAARTARLSPAGPLNGGASLVTAENSSWVMDLWTRVCDTARLVGIKLKRSDGPR